MVGKLCSEYHHFNQNCLPPTEKILKRHQYSLDLEPKRRLISSRQLTSCCSYVALQPNDDNTFNKTFDLVVWCPGIKVRAICNTGVKQFPL